MSFKHALSVRSQHSLGESLLSVEKIVDQARNNGYESVALVDTMNISGMVEFSKAAKKVGIKPIVGCRLRIMDGDPTEKGKEVKKATFWMPKVYVRNEDGLRDLMALLSVAYQDDHFYYVPRLGLDELLDTWKRGNLAMSTGDAFSAFYRAPVDRDYLDILERFRSAGNAREALCVEVCPIDTPLYDMLNKKAIQAAKALDLPIISTYPMFYAQDDDASTLDVLNAIIRNVKMADAWRHEQAVRDFSLKTPEVLVDRTKRMANRLGVPESDVDAWCDQNVQNLVSQCGYQFASMPISLPKLATDAMAALITRCKEGWAVRLGQTVFGYKPSPADLPKYKDRLAYELSVIKKMGFADYFLLVQHIVMWSKKNGILVGPGRGSVGGSLIAYLLGITDVDPIRFNLLFERFINPDRIDLPDADLDFMSTRRNEVVDHVVKQFGRDRVAGVSNYGTLASGSAIRDTGRVYGLTQDQLSCTKLVPKEHGQPIELLRAADAVPEIEKFSKAHPDVWNHALKLEGCMRSLGKHAAGVIISGDPLTTRAVVETRGDGEPTVNWDKRIVEDLGLVKVDVLGLSTLDILALARKLIKERHGVNVDLTRLPLDEKPVLEAFGRGDTIGVFQFEGFGMRKVLKDLALGGPLSFDDLSAATALFRPGPLDAGLCDDYIACKQGARSVVYEHPNMEPALKETFGVMVYQEQVMQVARDLCGFSMTEADHLRKAIGKKDAKKMAEMRDKFVEGAINHSGMKRPSAEYLWSQVEGYAAYSFNKSHSVEYSLISWQCMWVKVNYPAEFYAACLTVMDEDKLPGLVADAQKHGIYVVPPDINLSTQRFEIGLDVARDQRVLYTPFNRAKGISENTAKMILEARKTGKFLSKADFIGRVNTTKVNRRHQSTLDKVGAFASVEPSQLDARHPDRLKDQMELLPGLVSALMKADRKLAADTITKATLVSYVKEVKECKGCSLAGATHPTPRLGRSAKFMVVTDCPTKSEEKAGRLMEGDMSAYVKLALKDAGLGIGDVYFTTLVRACRVDKQLTNEQILGCSPYLDKEIALLKPPVIVALGSCAVRHLVPDAKGNWAELSGKVVYSAKLDASIVMGFNPSMIYHRPEEQDNLNAIFKKVAEMIQ